MQRTSRPNTPCDSEQQQCLEFGRNYLNGFSCSFHDSLMRRMETFTVSPRTIDKGRLSMNHSTFPAAGKIGLWTKADAQTHFDNLMVTGK
jgi:hypothetical protein